MKTPREILLARHRAAEPKLDAIRQSTVAAVCHRRQAQPDMMRRSQTAATGFLQTLWRELIWPSRRTWAGLAAVWLLILAVNVSLRDSSPVVAVKSPSAAELIIAWQQQQQLMAELNGLPSPRDADRQKVFTPKPRTERAEMMAV